MCFDGLRKWAKGAGEKTRRDVTIERRPMSGIEKDEKTISRRDIFGLGSVAVAAATLTMVGERMAEAQQQSSHTAPNESNPGPQNRPLAAENPDSEGSPSTDSGTVKPFKYSFALARKRALSGGWTG